MHSNCTISTLQCISIVYDGSLHRYKSLVITLEVGLSS